MKDNDWNFLKNALRGCGFEAEDPPSEDEELHTFLARVNSIPSEEALEWLSGLFQILPLNPARAGCSTHAEVVFRSLAVHTDDPEPWLPLGTVGPLLICAHYSPACSEFWKISAEFLVPVLIPRAKYDALLKDVSARLVQTPLRNSERVHFSESLPENGTYQQMLSWLLREYPFEEKELRSKLEQELGKVSSDSERDFSHLKNLPRHIAPALHRLATGEPCFNAEYAPTQSVFPETLLEKHGVYPMYCGKKVVYLLSSQKDNFSFEDEWLSGGHDPVEFRTVWADKETITAVIARERSKTASANTVEMSGELTYSDVANIVEIDIQDMMRVNPSSINVTSEQVVHWVLYRAITGRASDLHIEKYFNTARFRARIDGEMKVIHSCPEEMLVRFISLIKNYSNMGQRRQDAQDARFSLILGKKRVDCRVSAIPCRRDLQKITIRFLDKEGGVKKLSELRLSPRQTGLFNSAMGRDQGLILITGPTGSGKTTTLYALLNSVNSENINIHTVEDPIEYEIEGMNQTQTDPQVNLDFSEGLRRLMRADPDVILIGECRDNETAMAAINAALTGHLVLTTLHANDCLRAVSRLISMGVPSYLLADSLALTQAQRLVRRLCTFCKRPATLTGEVKAKFETNGVPIPPETQTIYVGGGCPECGESGYSGRIALMELCDIDNVLADLISRNAPQAQMRRVAFKRGMLTLYQEGLVQVLGGQTTLEEINCLAYTSIEAESGGDEPPEGKIVGMPVRRGAVGNAELAVDT